MQNKTNSKYHPTRLPQLSPLHSPAPCWVPAPSSTLEQELQEEQKRHETRSRPQAIFNLMVRDCWRAITGTTWLAHRCGDGNQCSSWQFKWRSPTPGFPHSSAIGRSFLFLISLLLERKALRQRESKQPAHLTTLLSGASSSLGICQGWGQTTPAPVSILHMQFMPIIIWITSRVTYSFTKQTATN